MRDNITPKAKLNAIVEVSETTKADRLDVGRNVKSKKRELPQHKKMEEIKAIKVLSTI